MNLLCRLDYPSRKKSPANLSDEIAVSFGTQRESYRVVADQADFCFSRYHGEDDFRLDDIYCYTNTKLWRRAALFTPPSRIEPVFFEFDLPGEMTDTRSLEAELDFVFDEERRCVAFVFSDVPKDCRTFAVADNLLLLCDESFALCQIVFCELAFHAPTPSSGA